MAGPISKLLDTIIEKRSKGNPTIALTTKTKLIFKGFDPDNFNAGSPDDLAAIEKTEAIATSTKLPRCWFSASVALQGIAS